MDGVPLDAILLVSLVLLVLISAVFFTLRKWRSNQGRGATSGAESSAGGDAAPGRLARHPGGECPICLSVEVVDPVQTNCGHWFCARCILEYYEGNGRARIKCPLCRQEVTMLHEAAQDTPPPKAPDAAAAGATAAAAAPDPAAARANAAPDAATPSTPAAPAAPAAAPSGSPEIRERLARFNDRNTRRRRSPWQVIEDAPLLLRRLWSDLRRGDTQVFGELIRRGVQLQLFVVALYILSPVDVIPESLLGLAGLIDDFVIAIILILHITTVYRTILLSWERSRVARAAAAAVAAASASSGVASAGAGADSASGAAAAAAVPGPRSPSDSPLGAALAAVFAMAAGSIATGLGAGQGAAAFAAGAMGVAAASVRSSARAVPPMARDR